MVFRRVLLTGAIVWAAAIPLAAFAASRQAAGSSVYGFALAIYAAGHVVCHQLAARSFHLWGAALPVCARCTGIYAGAAVVALGLIASPRAASPPAATAARSRRLLLAALVPTALTLVYEWVTGVTPANWIRALAGFPIGAAVVWLIGTVNLDA